MSDEMEQGKPNSHQAGSENDVANSPSPVAATAHAAPPLDRWSARRAELKKQKRRAHRRRINAANTGG